MKVAPLLFLCLIALTSCAKPKDGAPGPQGTPGQTGPQGLGGVDGADADPFVAIKFCPSAPTVYPGSFPEYGFCISGHLYATYWDGHNAWTAEVVPGHYASTSTSAPCSFNVAANCKVTP